MLAAVAIILPIILLWVHVISANITRPLKRLIDHFYGIGDADFVTRMKWDSDSVLSEFFDDGEAALRYRADPKNRKKGSIVMAALSFLYCRSR